MAANQRFVLENIISSDQYDVLQKLDVNIQLKNI